MTKWDLTVPLDPAKAVEDFAKTQSLSIKISTLAGLPGALHWHISQPGIRGILEVTWHPKTARFWASCHANRHADWIEPMVKKLSAAAKHPDDNH